MIGLSTLLSTIGHRLSTIRAFRRDRKGIAAVEFAMLAPVLITAFIGTFEISEAITVSRKVTQTASTVADLVTQSSQINTAEMADIFKATETVMSPYGTSSLKVVVAAVGTDPGDKKVKVMWSKAQNTSAWAAGSAPPVAMPAGIDVTDNWLIISQVSYTYSAIFPALAKEFFGSENFDMEETFYLRPRNSATVEFY